LDNFAEKKFHSFCARGGFTCDEKNEPRFKIGVPRIHVTYTEKFCLWQFAQFRRARNFAPAEIRKFETER
jgi:hypothetical protein